MTPEGDWIDLPGALMSLSRLRWIPVMLFGTLDSNSTTLSLKDKRERGFEEGQLGLDGHQLMSVTSLRYTY